MERVECVVIGAVEREGQIGSGISSRNSEVIHAGIYYPKGSLKARTCIEGKWFLYRYCDSRGIPYNRCGKLIVATNDDQIGMLETIKANAAALGMPDLEFWDAKRAIALEPELYCTAALWSPTTGVIDSHGLMLAFQGDAEARGAMLAFNSPVTGGEAREDGILLEVGRDEPMRLLAEIVVNSAGLHAPDLARRIKGADSELIPRGWYCKGNYYTLLGRSPFKRLIYPVPEQAGLGVHSTIDLGGQCRFGPDYDVDPRRADVFYAEVRKYWPALKDGALVAGYAGIRPKITPKGAPAADFVVQGPAEHGVPGLINLLGIESPGLTASWAIACEAARKLGLPELNDDLA